jgi:hypothetical protein
MFAEILRALPAMGIFDRIQHSAISIQPVTLWGDGRPRPSKNQIDLSWLNAEC